MNISKSLTSKLTHIFRLKGPAVLQNSDVKIASEFDPKFNILEIKGFFVLNSKEYKVFYTRAKFSSEKIHLERIYVYPYFRRWGIGTAIIQTLKEIGKDKAIPVLSVSPDGYSLASDSDLERLLGPEPEDEMDAIAFYSKIGFIPIDDTDEEFYFLSLI